MKLSKKAIALLNKISKRRDSKLLLTRENYKTAYELEKAKLVDLIPRILPGVDIVLTTMGARIAASKQLLPPT